MFRFRHLKDTVFADISYYQVVLNRFYGYAFILFRSNDGTFRDPNFLANLRAARRLMRWGRLIGFGVYYVYHPGGSGLDTLKSVLAPFKGRWRWLYRWHMHRMVVVLDVESWGKLIKGDHSKDILAERESVISFLNAQRLRPFRKHCYARDRRRVGIYGNRGDLDTICPNHGDAWIGFADYDRNSRYPGEIYHQYASNYYVRPFGRCDINSADGLSPVQFARHTGIRRGRVAA